MLSVAVALLSLHSFPLLVKINGSFLMSVPSFHTISRMLALHASVVLFLHSPKPKGWTLTIHGLGEVTQPKKSAILQSQGRKPPHCVQHSSLVRPTCFPTSTNPRHVCGAPRKAFLRLSLQKKRPRRGDRRVPRWQATKCPQTPRSWLRVPSPIRPPRALPYTLPYLLPHARGFRVPPALHTDPSGVIRLEPPPRTNCGGGETTSSRAPLASSHY